MRLPWHRRDDFTPPWAWLRVVNGMPLIEYSDPGRLDEVYAFLEAAAREVPCWLWPLWEDYRVGDREAGGDLMESVSVSASGVPLTPALLDELADEAERGYDLEGATDGRTDPP